MTRLWWLVLAACGSDRATVPATVVHADVAMVACAAPCSTPIDLYGVCMPSADRLDAHTNEIDVVTALDANKVTGIVEIIYSGSVVADTDPARAPYVAYILGTENSAEVDAAGDGTLLYRIDPQHGVVDLDRTRLAAASGDMLRFEYAGTVEQHVIDKPRPISVNVYDDDVPCCSTATPSTGALWLLALALIVLRRARVRATTFGSRRT
jgi:hypothetical protein